MFRSTFLRCSPRARGHARAYRQAKRGEIVAICDMNEELLGAFDPSPGLIGALKERLGRSS
jgi:predicted dehydrogenase